MNQPVTKLKTIHTSRTMMFAELEKVMAHSMDDGHFIDSLEQNVTGKRSKSGVQKTASYLKRLYGFDPKNAEFRAFQYFWRLSNTAERPLIAFVYAVHHDTLLSNSIEIVSNVTPGKKVPVELIEAEIEKYHPNQYSANTLRSIAQNIASSWKQAGFIVGKVKNIRTQPEISFRVACFSFVLAYLSGMRGDFIWNSIGVNALCLPESKLRELAIECAKRDMMQYQFAGSVTSISFANLFNKIGLDAV